MVLKSPRASSVMTTTSNTELLTALIKPYCENIERDLQARLANWKPDFNHVHVHEVIGGLLARQVALAIQIASNPMIWNGDAAPILLRAMVDVYINIAWLLGNPSDRCLKFISYGVGQAKLELEHRRAQRGDVEPSEQELELEKSSESWINSQRLMFLQDVDLGSWSGISVRQMATEADCLDFYNYVYSPFSGCAHSMWQHVAMYNLIECTNPLHRYHREPTVRQPEIDIWYLDLAAKYANKTLKTFDSSLGMKIDHRSAYAALHLALDKLEAEEVENDETLNGGTKES